MRARNLNVLALLTATAVGLGGCGGDQGANGEMAAGEAPAAETGGAAAPQQEVSLAEGVTREQYDQGRQLFTGQGGCHACHGPNATGTQLAPDLTDDEWINIAEPSVEAVVSLIQTGVPQPEQHPAPMPPMGGANLNDDQVRALAGYVLSIAGD